MGIPDDRLYEYAVVRYVPRVDRGEFVNIGLIMMCKRCKWLKGQIVLDKARILGFDPKANLGALYLQASVFERSNVPSAEMPVEERYRWLTAVKSAVIQVSPSHPGIIPPAEPGDISDSSERLEAEFRRLLDDLILLGR